jgi:hypothetical protein
MPRPVASPINNSFRLPPILPVTKITLDDNNDIATIYYAIKGQQRIKTFPFNWDAKALFESAVDTFISKEK